MKLEQLFIFCISLRHQLQVKLHNLNQHMEIDVYHEMVFVVGNKNLNMAELTLPACINPENMLKMIELKKYNKYLKNFHSFLQNDYLTFRLMTKREEEWSIQF